MQQQQQRIALPNPDDLLLCYLRLKSIYKVAEIYGVCGQTILTQLRKCPRYSALNTWSEADIPILKAAYTRTDERNEMGLTALAQRLGRLKSNICRKARSLGLTKASRHGSKQQQWFRQFATIEELKEYQSKQMKTWHKTHQHPRGAFGMRRSE